MFIPAAKLVRDKGLDVWANGPHIAANGSSEASATVWQQYLELTSFTTLFEMSVTPRWTAACAFLTWFDLIYLPVCVV